MNAGDFRTPFFLMAVCLLVANLIFWQFFAWREEDLVAVPLAESGEVAIVGD